jgi:serine/threonine protein phosphatase 1
MRTFVMGDIHGAYKALKQCLERANFDVEQDHLIQLGDIVDGYPDVFECIETLLGIKNSILIKGNHDDWFQTFFETGYHPVQWRTGGRGTLISYLHHAGKARKIYTSGSGFQSALSASDIPLQHQQLFKQQRLYYIDSENRCFVHGGFDRHVPFALQKPATFYWDRDLFEAALQKDSYYEKGVIPEGFYSDTRFREIYIGHTATTHWNRDQPMKALNITNLDTGAGHDGRLTIMELPSSVSAASATRETNPFWQSDPLPTLYPHGYR